MTDAIDRYERALKGQDPYHCVECGLTYPTEADARECARLDLDPRKEPHRKNAPRFARRKEGR